MRPYTLPRRDVALNTLGDPNDLENSEDCRGAGGHGNQHVRLRSAQISEMPGSGSDAGAGHASGSRAARADEPSNVLGIEKIEIDAAVREIGQIGCRGFAFGRSHTGLEGVPRIKGPW